jgi:hypothetical protein
MGSHFKATKQKQANNRGDYTLKKSHYQRIEAPCDGEKKLEEMNLDGRFVVTLCSERCGKSGGLKVIEGNLLNL